MPHRARQRTPTLHPCGARRDVPPVRGRRRGAVVRCCRSAVVTGQALHHQRARCCSPGVALLSTSGCPALGNGAGRVRQCHAPEALDSGTWRRVGSREPHRPAPQGGRVPTPSCGRTPVPSMTAAAVMDGAQRGHGDHAGRRSGGWPRCPCLQDQYAVVTSRGSSRICMGSAGRCWPLPMVIDEALRQQFVSVAHLRRQTIVVDLPVLIGVSTR